MADELKRVLLYSTGLNYAILFLWSGAFIFAHDWIYSVHRRWFKLEVETFDALNYGAIAVYKIGILLLNLIPLLALYLAL